MKRRERREIFALLTNKIAQVLGRRDEHFDPIERDHPNGLCWRRSKEQRYSQEKTVRHHGESPIAGEPRKTKELVPMGLLDRILVVAFVQCGVAEAYGLRTAGGSGGKRDAANIRSCHVLARSGGE